MILETAVFLGSAYAAYRLGKFQGRGGLPPTQKNHTRYTLEVPDYPRSKEIAREELERATDRIAARIITSLDDR